jgi:hypothetical protein
MMSDLRWVRGANGTKPAVADFLLGAIRRPGGGHMPLYNFDLVNWKAIVDAGGADLADDIEAIDSADNIARRLIERLPQLKNKHYAVLVTNEDGDEVCRLPLDVLH